MTRCDRASRSAERVMRVRAPRAHWRRAVDRARLTAPVQYSIPAASTVSAANRGRNGLWGDGRLTKDLLLQLAALAEDRENFGDLISPNASDL